MAEVASDTLLDNRYRILGLIGSGGMADVYSAEDTHLERQLALKVLHRRFAQDTQFIERFRREASSAAALSHPNVVNVFDRGEHEGTYYIAMEYLPGRTLKDLLGEEAPLPQERAIDLALQVLKAAGFAHARGVIHRDFKPHNVIVGSDDGVKVTDFGIARAGASEITETGSIMGTAQYLSPEQAQGQGVTAASDVYSIGVMLYEMLAGRVPFTGESAVSIALKHVNEPPPPLGSLRSDLHPALEAAVMRALAKRPEDRYASAEEFMSALEDARRRILAGEDGAPGMAVAPVPVAVEESVALPEEEPRKEWRRRPWLLALPLLALALLLALAALLGPEDVAVPPVVGTPLLQAQATLERAGLEVAIERVRNPAPVDQVVDQDPKPGTDVDRGSAVKLFVSTGPGERLVPSVRGLSQRRALQALNGAGFGGVDVDTRPSGTVRKGFAIRTVPGAGVRAELDSRIRLFISSGPPLAVVPNVTGLSRSAAQSRLEGEGFAVAVEQRAGGGPSGRVVDQAPDAGRRVARGARVTIAVSTGARGARQARVPSVAGLSAAQARAELQRAGFAVQTHQRAVSSSAQDGVVVSQLPAAGTRLTKGRTVVLFVGDFRAPSPAPPRRRIPRPPERDPGEPEQDPGSGAPAPSPEPPPS